MNVEEYKKLKEQRKAESIERERHICLKCRRPIDRCYCQYVKEFDPGITFVILMHPMEAKKERVGTGRLAHLCLKNSKIIIGLDFTNDQEVNNLINDKSYFPMVMYPGASAHNISEKPMDKDIFEGKTPLIFVIDGTWPCAKKMMKLSKNLHNLPRVCFTPRERSQFEVKQQPHPMCLSTIESIHFFIGEWNAANNVVSNDRDVLMDVFLKMVEFQKQCALDPNLPSYRHTKFRPVNIRKPSKKWQKYKLFYD